MSKTSQLTELTTGLAQNDILQVVDVSDLNMATSGTNKKITIGNLATGLGNSGTLQATIPAGTTSQYWRGDKTWQTLNKAVVGLTNVDNTSDANKPVSTATQTALNLKANLASPTFTGTVTLPTDVVISGSSSGDAVRITQTGSGNALVVEDSANPDATPFVINSSGQLFIGKTSSEDTGLRTIDIISNGGASVANNGNIRSIRCADEVTGIIYSQGRTRGSAQTQTIVQADDSLGNFVWSGYDGVDQIVAARISSLVDGTPGANDMPGRLEFSTTSDGAATPTERMRITSSGNVGIGTTSPNSKLHIAGDLTVSSATVATSATAGTNGDVPVQVAGYLVVNINGTARKIPYYA
jgi:hypothetical protein